MLLTLYCVIWTIRTVGFSRRSRWPGTHPAVRPGLRRTTCAAPAADGALLDEIEVRLLNPIVVPPAETVSMSARRLI